MTTPPPPGFADVLPDMVHRPSGLRVWFTKPLGVLTQVTEQTRGDLAMARFLSGPVTERLFSLRRDVTQKLWFLHEWSAMSGYTKETRAEMTQWGLAIRRDIERIVVCLGPSAPALVRMGVSVASTALTMAGIKLDMTKSMEETLERWEVRPRDGSRSAMAR